VSESRLDRNPYSPPKAPVADAPIAELPRPRNVRVAVWLLWISVVLNIAAGVIATVSTSSAIDGLAGILTLSTVCAIAFGLAFWIFGAIARGRRWARIVGTAIVLLLFADMAGAGFSGIPLLSALTYLVEFSLQAVAVALLFTPSANAWFRPRG
jgi:hypothetical protein